ncbi:MAG: IS3 family transposase, partial [Nitrosomonadaceae bacterium]
MSLRQQHRQRVSDAVEAIYNGFKKRYGSPRITMELNAQGIACCANHVAKLLQEKGLRTRNGKAFKYCARIESKTNVSDNLLARQFKADA